MSHALYFNLCIYKSALSTEREAVGEAKIVIRRLTDERNDVHVCEALFDKACKIASEFEITASSSRIVGRQKNRATYPVDNPFDCCKISLCLVFLDHLVGEISKRVVGNEGSFLRHLI